MRSHAAFLAALVLAASPVAQPALGTTLFSDPPWIVTFDNTQVGEPACAISVLSDEGYGVSVEQRANDVTVNILDMDKNYPLGRRAMWVAVDGEIYRWDGTLLGNIAMTTQDTGDASVVSLLGAFASQQQVEIGTGTAPAAVFNAPPSGKASVVFDLCKDLL